jgi:hypothetical protein
LAFVISQELVLVKHIQHQGLAKSNLNFGDRAIAKKKNTLKRPSPRLFVFAFGDVKIT